MTPQHTNIAKTSDGHPKQPSYSILLIEDDSHVANMICKITNQLNLATDYATNPQDALELAAQNQYDLAILDLHLDNEDGLKLINQLRQQYPHIEFITMTENNPKWIETQARQQKVLYHLVKPILVNEFTAMLEFTVNKKAASRKAEKTTIKKEPS